MPKNLTTNQKAEVAKEELKVRNLVTIHTDNPIRILENDTLTSFDIGGETYLAGRVKRGDVETNMEGKGEKVQITISNINQGVSSLVTNYGDVLTNTKCTLETVIFDGDTSTIVDDPIQIFEGRINNVELTALEFKFDIERILGGYSSSSPNATYDVNCQCKKFKDERCGYTGSETTCDKTLTRCKELGNVLNFYGFPSIPQEMVVSG